MPRLSAASWPPSRRRSTPRATGRGAGPGAQSLPWMTFWIRKATGSMFAACASSSITCSPANATVCADTDRMQLPATQLPVEPERLHRVALVGEVVHRSWRVGRPVLRSAAGACPPALNSASRRSSPLRDSVREVDGRRDCPGCRSRRGRPLATRGRTCPSRSRPNASAGRGRVRRRPGTSARPRRRCRRTARRRRSTAHRAGRDVDAVFRQTEGGRDDWPRLIRALRAAKIRAPWRLRQRPRPSGQSGCETSVGSRTLR